MLAGFLQLFTKTRDLGAFQVDGGWRNAALSLAGFAALWRACLARFRRARGITDLATSSARIDFNSNVKVAMANVADALLKAFNS